MITIILQFTIALFLIIFLIEILNKLIPKMFVFISEEKNKDYVFAIIVAIFIFFNILFLKTPMKTFINSEVVIFLFKILYLIISSISIYIFKKKIYEANYYIYDYKFKIQSIDNKPCGYLSNAKTVLINQKKPVTLSKTSDKKIDITINDVNNKIEISDELKKKIYFVLNKTDRNNTKIEEVEKLKFKKLDENIHQELKNKIINEGRAIINDSELLILSEGKKLECKLKWTDKIGQKSSTKSRNKEITYGFIFDIFHDYFIEGGIKGLKGDKRKELVNFIIENFNKDDEQIKYENLNKSFTNWNPLKV